MYNYPNSDETLEKKFFNKIDSVGANVIKKIIRLESVDSLNSKEVEGIITFVAAQTMRVPRIREDMRRLRKSLSVLDIDSASIHNRHEDLQISFLDEIKTYTKKFRDKLKEKKFKYLKNKSDSKFIISDNPIARHNINDTFIIEDPLHPKTISDIILIPLSPTGALVFYPENKDFKGIVSNSLLIDDINFEITIGAERFIYGSTEISLTKAIKIYSDRAKKIISASSRENSKHIESLGDEVVVIGQPEIKFEDRVIDQVKIWKH